MQRELELCDDAKIATPASNSPEQVRVLIGAGAQHLSVCRNHLSSDQIVDCHSVFARKPTEATTQSQTCYSGCRIDPDRCRQAVELNRLIEVPKRGTRLDVSSTRARVDMHVL